MIALSVKQPWASLLMTRKTIETRTWSSPYRGPILICSGQSPDAAAIVRFGGSPADWETKFPPGIALGVIQIVDVRPMRQTDEIAACCPYRPGLFAWVRGPIVAPVRRFPVRGQLGLFKVDVPADAMTSPTP